MKLPLSYLKVDAGLLLDNPFLELVPLNKMTEGDFSGTTCEEITEVVKRVLVKDMNGYSDVWESDVGNDDGEGEMAESDASDSISMEWQASNGLVHAGYVDCMDEAIRFLVEEENLSPEHPMVRNLKAYLEMSGKRLFGALTFQREANSGTGSDRNWPYDSAGRTIHGRVGNRDLG